MKGETGRFSVRDTNSGAANWKSFARGSFQFRLPFFSLTARILALNVLALGVLVVGLLYLGEYRDSLIDAKVESTEKLATMIAGAVGESGVITGKNSSDAHGILETDAEIPEVVLYVEGKPLLDSITARQMVRRMLLPLTERALLFDKRGFLVVDSRLLEGGQAVEQRVLPPLRDHGWSMRAILSIYDWIVGQSPWRPQLPVYSESTKPHAFEFPEAIMALEGGLGHARRLSDETVILSVAVPVQRLKLVLGVLILQADTRDIETEVYEVRLAILRVFSGVLALTVLLSIYLAGTIARPIKRLAYAADQVQRATNSRASIPDFTARRDEIGDLSRALRGMTKELYERLDAIESFAADVVHELKNPLASIHSAVDGIETIKDPEQKQALMTVLKDDLRRIDLLISDIFMASCLDAELARVQFSLVNVGDLLETLVAVYRDSRGDRGPNITVDLKDREHLGVEGIEDRLGQVVHNLVDNAVSFSGSGSSVLIRATATACRVRVMVEDEGPGLREQAIKQIFDRFYTDRGDDTNFGQHSGLGLSICKRIVEAHGGAIIADNRIGLNGDVIGARFIVDLPAANMRL